MNYLNGSYMYIKFLVKVVVVLVFVCWGFSLLACLFFRSADVD